MPRYFTKKIGTDELLQKIWSTLEKNDPVAAKDIKENMGGTGMSLREIIEDGCIVYWNFTPSLEKDLNKISFDYENVGSGPESLLCDSENNDMKDIMGFKTLDNGLTFLGLQAGGDWEHPIFFIVYSDGSQLRAYIPEKGNVFNTDTKQAFGNDEEADAKNLLKRGVIDQKAADEIIGGEMSAAPYDLLHFDVKKLKEDIFKRITYKNEN